MQAEQPSMDYRKLLPEARTPTRGISSPGKIIVLATRITRISVHRNATLIGHAAVILGLESSALKARGLKPRRRKIWVWIRMTHPFQNHRAFWSDLRKEMRLDVSESLQRSAETGCSSTLPAPRI